LFVGEKEREEMAARYRRGGFGYGEVKQALADVAEKFFAEAREYRKELEAKPQFVREILGDGAAMARKRAAEVLQRAQSACGIKY
jgi:tryptophanyl-tRNA synthetase